MIRVRIVGPAHIADSEGTHAPDDIVEQPSAALVALAEAKTINPESGQPYAVLISDAPAAAPVPAATEPAQTEEAAA